MKDLDGASPLQNGPNYLTVCKTLYFMLPVTFNSRHDFVGYFQDGCKNLQDCKQVLPTEPVHEKTNNLGF